MASRHERLYKNKPHLARGEDGHMGVKEDGPTEAEKTTDEVQSGTDGMKVAEGMAPHVRHAQERRDMHNRHETEHAVHDTGKGGSKEEMYTRHQKELKDMSKRHEKEVSGGEGHETEKDKAASKPKAEKKE